MTDLTQDELTVLLIAAKGEPMMPIGRWRPAATSLVDKGLLKPTPHVGDPDGFFNLRITPAGSAAAEQEETAYDNALSGAMTRAMSAEHEHKKIRASAEQIAVQLVDLAETSQKVTGDDKVEALRNWARTILERALEIMR